MTEIDLKRVLDCSYRFRKLAVSINAKNMLIEYGFFNDTDFEPMNVKGYYVLDNDQETYETLQKIKAYFEL